MSILTVTEAIHLLTDARTRSIDRGIFAEGEASIIVDKLRGFSVADTRAITEACGFEWRGSRPKTLACVHEYLDAGWRAWRRIQA